MYKFRYSHEKNALLLKTRGIGFEEIINSINDGNLLDIREHTNAKYIDQKILIVRILKEVYQVPFVIEKNGALFLNTLFPSRKVRKQFLDNVSMQN